MSSEVAVRCRGLGKAFQLYARRTDQVKQLLFGSFHRFYREYWVLRDVDLDVRRGESVAIVGRNGAGKTTLLRLLCGITEPTRGELLIHGRIAPILALGAAFDWEMTGRQNVMIGGAVLGLRRSEILRRLPSIAEFAAIGPFIDQPARLYSSGMRSRLAFAICAHADADILLVDEALAVGDAAFRQKSLAFLRSFRDRGTLIVVSHDLDQIRETCERAIWIDDAGIRADGPVAEVLPLYEAASEAEADDGARFAFDAARLAVADGARAPRRE
ncbi:MAG TPA: ABC transporter ATP-binding protein [Stellaceae bacterium]|nr:ABC transporter ATP-binding protein [Stellaceae bacterium]